MQIHQSLESATVVQFLFGDGSPFGTVLADHKLELKKTALQLRSGDANSFTEIYRLVFAADALNRTRRQFFVVIVEEFSSVTVKVLVGEPGRAHRDARRVGDVIKRELVSGARACWPAIARTALGDAAPLLLEQLAHDGSSDDREGS